MSYAAFLLKGVGQVAVSIGEVRLQLNGTLIGVYGQVDQTLFIIDTGQVAVHNCMVWTQAQGSQVGCNSSKMRDATNQADDPRGAGINDYTEHCPGLPPPPGR